MRIDDHRSDRPSVPEFHFLRSVACLGVVAIHALTIGFWIRDDPLPGVSATLQAFQMLLMFSTPTFVFLSAALLGYRYDRAPPGFLSKRCRFVVVPFVSMSFAFALYYALKNVWRSGELELFAAEVVSSGFRNLAGGNHLWFIIPIVQFYILYRLLGHRLNDVSPAIALAGALVLNVAYVAFFNFTPPRADYYSSFVGRHWYSLLFPAWAFYFVAGIYAGSRYSALQGFLRRRIGSILLALVVSGSLMLFLHFSGLLHDVSSRRADVLLYTFPMIMTLLYAASRLRKIPSFVTTISRYSFGIYILHPLALNLLWPLLVPFVQCHCRSSFLFCGSAVPASRFWQSGWWLRCPSDPSSSVESDLLIRWVTCHWKRLSQAGAASPSFERSRPPPFVRPVKLWRAEPMMAEAWRRYSAARPLPPLAGGKRGVQRPRISEARSSEGTRLTASRRDAGGLTMARERPR